MYHNLLRIFSLCLVSKEKKYNILFARKMALNNNARGIITYLEECNDLIKIGVIHFSARAIAKCSRNEEEVVHYGMIGYDTSDYKRCKILHA